MRSPRVTVYARNRIDRMPKDKFRTTYKFAAGIFSKGFQKPLKFRKKIVKGLTGQKGRPLHPLDIQIHLSLAGSWLGIYF